MPEYTLELLDEGIILLAYCVPVTADVFRRATQDRVRFAQEHVEGDYVLIVDYSQTTMSASYLNLRLNTWSATLDPHMIDALLISPSMLAMTAADLVQRVTHLKVEMCDSRAEALARARAILAERQVGRV